MQRSKNTLIQLNLVRRTNMILPLDCAALFSQPSKYANEMQPQSSPLPCPSKLTGT